MSDRAYMKKTATVEWETPRNKFDEWWEEVGGFDMDVACRPDHYTARRVLDNGGTIYVPNDTHLNSTISAFHGGLDHKWTGNVWCNPPWGLALRQWVPYAREQMELGHPNLVYQLVPATTDTQWWQENVVTLIERTMGDQHSDMPDVLSEVRFLKGRLTFSGAPAAATKGTALLIWRSL